MPSLNVRLEVAKSVASPLIELEKQIDGALTLQAAVVVAAIEGHRKARLPITAGHDALEKVLAAGAELASARKAVHEAHLALRQIQDQMGLGTVSYGDHGDTPTAFPTEDGKTALRVVAAA